MDIVLIALIALIALIPLTALIALVVGVTLTFLIFPLSVASNENSSTEPFSLPAAPTTTQYNLCFPIISYL